MSQNAPRALLTGRLLSSVRAIEVPPYPSDFALRQFTRGAASAGGVEYCSGHRLEFVQEHLGGEICECLLRNGQAVLVPASAIKWERAKPQ